MPATEKVAVVVFAVGLAKVTVPGPLSFDHVTVTVAGGLGKPSSVTVPLRLLWNLSSESTFPRLSFLKRMVPSYPSPEGPPTISRSPDDWIFPAAVSRRNFVRKSAGVPSYSRFSIDVPSGEKSGMSRPGRSACTSVPSTVLSVTLTLSEIRCGS